MNVLQEILHSQKRGISKGVYSCCSANGLVIKTALKKGMETNSPVLIEATSNQVNQFGGYTGSTPEAFYKYVNNLADETGFNKENLILGGDHLGPLVWSGENEDSAMDKAEELVALFCKAGFSKIHIDTSMKLASDETDKKLPVEIIAKRAARLVLAAERNKEEGKNIFYVIGSEVPPPGGIQYGNTDITVTTPSDAEETLSIFADVFKSYGLEDAFERVIALVVQPGIDFGDSEIIPYSREKSRNLTEALKKHKNIILEGHSTDFQTRDALKMMVEDGIAILKGGPAFTFAMREALISLECIEKELFFGKNTELSDFKNKLYRQMLSNPEKWEKHYSKKEIENRLLLTYSFSDRARYYIYDNEMKNSIHSLVENLRSTDIPYTLLSQYMPNQYKKIRNGLVSKEPVDLIKDKISEYIEDYLYAAGYIV